MARHKGKSSALLTLEVLSSRQEVERSTEMTLAGAVAPHWVAALPHGEFAKFADRDNRQILTTVFSKRWHSASFD